VGKLSGDHATDVPTLLDAVHFAVPASPASPRQQLLIGLIAVIAGLPIVAVATGIFPVPEQSFRAPHWVVGAAGLVFVLAGAMFLAPLLIGGFAPADQYTQRQKQAIRLIQQLLGSLLLSGFAAITSWIGFGPGERTFSMAIAIPGFASHAPGNATAGRVLFGTVGALIGVWAAVTWVALIRSVIAIFRKTPQS